MPMISRIKILTLTLVLFVIGGGDLFPSVARQSFRVMIRV